jgi:hypothetical protein
MRKHWLLIVCLVFAVIGGALLAGGIATRAAAGTGGEKEVSFLSGGGLDLVKVPLSRGHGDRVRWSNQDDRGHTISFTDWPFAEPPEAIQVRVGEKSHWYTVYAKQADGKYEYSIDPPLKPASNGPPDGPSVEVGP